MIIFLFTKITTTTFLMFNGFKLYSQQVFQVEQPLLIDGSVTTARRLIVIATTVTE